MTERIEEVVNVLKRLGFLEITKDQLRKIYFDEMIEIYDNKEPDIDKRWRFLIR